MATKQSKQEKGTEPAGKQAQASAVAASPSRLRSLIRYFEDAKTELGKVSWPTKKEVRSTALAVLFMVVLMSVFLGLADWIFSGILSAILGMGS